MSFIDSIREKFGKKNKIEFENRFSGIHNPRDIPHESPAERRQENFGEIKSNVLGERREYGVKPYEERMRTDFSNYRPSEEFPKRDFREYEEDRVVILLDRISRQNEMIIDLLKEINFNIRYLRR